MDIEALVQDVSDVSSSSTEESHSLNGLTLVVSSNGSVSISGEVSGSDLDGDYSSSVGESSDRLGSPVKDPPLSVVSWVVVSDPESVLVCTNMLVPEEGSVGSHSRLDLELDSVSEWVSWVVEWSSVEVEGLLGVVAADLENHVTTIPSSVVEVKAVSSWRSDVSHSTWVV